MDVPDLTQSELPQNPLSSVITIEDTEITNSAFPHIPVSNVSVVKTTELMQPELPRNPSFSVAIENSVHTLIQSSNNHTGTPNTLETTHRTNVITASQKSETTQGSLSMMPQSSASLIHRSYGSASNVAEAAHSMFLSNQPAIHPVLQQLEIMSQKYSMLIIFL